MIVKKEGKYLYYNEAKVINLKYCVKVLLNMMYQIWYKILYFFIRPETVKNTKYNASICAIFRDEALYLKEWIEFNRLVGVEHFYLYNNFSKDHYLDVLQPYIDSGIVSLKDWPVKQGQMSAYQDFFDTHAHETKWVGLIDIDEFVIPNKHNNIYDFLKGFENRPSVIIYWKVMGSGGKLSRSLDGLVTEDLVIGHRKYVDIGKCFFNTKYEYTPNYKRNGHMHFMWAKCKGIMLPPVNVFDRICSYGVNPVPNDDMPVQINHYLIKTYQEYFDKKAKRGGGVHDISMHNVDYYYRNEMKSQKADYSAYKYLVKLKLSMGISDKK